MAACATPHCEWGVLVLATLGLVWLALWALYFASTLASTIAHSLRRPHPPPRPYPWTDYRRRRPGARPAGAFAPRQPAQQPPSLYHIQTLHPRTERQIKRQLQALHRTAAARRRAAATTARWL